MIGAVTLVAATASWYLTTTATRRRLIGTTRSTWGTAATPAIRPSPRPTTSEARASEKSAGEATVGNASAEANPGKTSAEAPANHVPAEAPADRVPADGQPPESSIPTNPKGIPIIRPERT